MKISKKLEPLFAGLFASMIIGLLSFLSFETSTGFWLMFSFGSSTLIVLVFHDSEGSGIEIHGGSSFIRNVGYVGYHSASLETSIDDPTRGKAGFRKMINQELLSLKSLFHMRFQIHHLIFHQVYHDH